MSDRRAYMRDYMRRRRQDRATASSPTRNYSCRFCGVDVPAPLRGRGPRLTICETCRCGVYALVDDGDAVRYIGASTNIAARYAHHRSAVERPDKQELVHRRGLAALRLLEACPADRLGEREAAWIDIQRLLGAPLDLLRSHRQAPQLIGQQIGFWTVLELDRDGAAQIERRWLCRCACGTRRSVREAALVNRASRSCGCMRLITG